MITVEEACERLDLARSHFHELRGIALQAAVDGLEPGIPGRPRKVREVSERERFLGRRVRELEAELTAERVRSQMALVMPGMLRPLPKGDARLTPHRAKARLRKRAITHD